MWGEEEEDEEEEDEEEAVRPGTAAGCIYKVPKVDTRPNLPPTYLPSYIRYTCKHVHT